MLSLYVPGPIKCNRIPSFCPRSFSGTYNNSCNISLPRKLTRKVDAHGSSISSFSFQSSFHRNLYSKKLRGLSLIAFDAKNSESEGQDDQALDPETKSSSSFKNKNPNQFSADEFRSVPNFLSFFQDFQGNRQVLELFSNLMSKFANNIQIVMKPTIHDGMNVGVQWKFEWSQINIPLGNGFSLHISHTYHGKAVIRNIQMFMEPLVHLEPLRLKMKISLREFMEKIRSFSVPESGKKPKRALYVGLASLSLFGFFIFMKLAS